MCCVQLALTTSILDFIVGSNHGLLVKLKLRKLKNILWRAQAVYLCRTNFHSQLKSTWIVKMAEVVHRNLEAMLPQLEELEASGIFSHQEIR